MKGSRILVILEDYVLRSKIKKILSMAKYHVFDTESGKSAMEIVRIQDIDIIICGIKIPEMDGFGVLRLVNKFIETSGIGFIMLLRHDEEHLTRRVMELGADGYFIHPFDDGELLNQIEVRLRKRKFQMELFAKKMLQVRDLNRRPEELNILKSHFDVSLPYSIRKNQIIYHRGTRPAGLYYVSSGRIKTFVSDDSGNEFITGIHTDGQFFGLSGLLLGIENNENAEAMDHSKVCMLPLMDIEKLISENSSISEVFIKHLSWIINERDEQLLNLAYYSVRKRIATIILKLSKVSYQDRVLQQASFDMARNDLAAVAGVATETLSRVLGDFSKEGLIKKVANEIIVMDSKSLREMRN